MSKPGCSCEISDILSYDGDGTLTINGDLVVEGKTNSPAAVVIGTTKKPSNLWVTGGADIGNPTGYAASKSTRKIHFWFARKVFRMESNKRIEQANRTSESNEASVTKEWNRSELVR